MRAAIYARISADANGQGLGVERQRADCTALAATNGWTVACVFTDNDVSAYSGKPRPGYRALTDAIKAGTVDAVVTWHPDRLHRSPAELEGFIALLEKHSVTVATVEAGHWDLSTPSGRLVARQLGAVARFESEHKSARVRRALEQRAAMGQPHGRTAYGYRREYAPDGTSREVVVSDEAAVIREIARRIVGGDSIRAITADLNRRGIPSPTGKQWRKNMLRWVVQRERNAGLRVHHGEVIGDADWPPILDRGVWEQVRAILRDPQRRTSTGTAAKHLLSGIATCGVPTCGAAVVGTMNRTTPSYRCPHGHVSRSRERVDELVEGVIVALLSRPDAADLLAPERSAERATAVEEIRAVRARLDLAADQFADGVIDARQLERITTRLRPLLQAAESLARAIDDSPLLAGLAGNPDAGKVWASLPITRKRAVVDSLMTVRIKPSQTPGRFDLRDIEIASRVAL